MTIEVTPTDPHALDRWESLPTSVVCDVFDEFGWSAPALDVAIGWQTTRTGTIAGWAYTIEGRRSDAKGPDVAKLEAVDATPKDSIAIWVANDGQGICLFGDLIARTMHERGCKAAVVDGGFRDRHEIDTIGFPVLSRYTSPVQAIGRWRVDGVNVPVRIPAAAEGDTIDVRPGDLILVDGDGAIVVPRDRCPAVLERAEAILADEAAARDGDGKPLSVLEMLEKYGHV